MKISLTNVNATCVLIPGQVGKQDVSQNFLREALRVLRDKVSEVVKVTDVVMC